MLRLGHSVALRNTLSPASITRTKRTFNELGYYQPKYAKYGDDDFVEEDMFDSIKAFQRDKGLKEDGIMREDGPTQHRANAELLKRRRRALDPDGRKGLRDSLGLGLKDSVGRKAPNNPNDVRKVKRALSAVNLYPNQRSRLNDGKADDDLQYGLDYMGHKYAIGVDNGRIQRGSSAERHLSGIAEGNNIDYLSEALRGRVTKTRKDLFLPREPAQKPAPKKPNDPISAALEALLEVGKTSTSGKEQTTDSDIVIMKDGENEPRKEGHLGSDLANIFAQVLTLPSPNYVPKEVRGPNSDKAHEDDPTLNKDTEYNPSIVGNFLDRWLGTDRDTGESGYVDSDDYDSVATPSGNSDSEKPDEKESGSLLGGVFGVAHAAQPESDNDTDSTHQGRTKRETVELESSRIDLTGTRRKYEQDPESVILTEPPSTKTVWFEKGEWNKITKFLKNHKDEDGNKLSPITIRAIQELIADEGGYHPNSENGAVAGFTKSGLEGSIENVTKPDMPKNFEFIRNGKVVSIARKDITLETFQQNKELLPHLLSAFHANHEDSTNFGKYGGFLKAANKINDYEVISVVNRALILGRSTTRGALVQRSINSALPKGHKKIDVDNQIGPKTIDALATIAKDEKLKIKFLQGIEKESIRDAEQDEEMQDEDGKVLPGLINRFKRPTNER